MTTTAPDAIALDAWRAQAQAFDWRGHRIATWCGGEAAAAPLLLIHGFPTAAWDWHRLWPALAAHGRVLTLDMIGFGFSAKPRPYPYSILDQADLFEAFLRAQQVTHYHVLAHDYGDSVAQELLARRDEPGARPRLQSVCLLNGGLFPETHRALPVQRLLASPLGALVARAITRTRFARSMTRIFGPDTPPSPHEIDALWRTIEHGDGRGVMPALIGYLRERRRHRARWVGALQHATVPLRLIDGLHDPISGAHMVRRYRELVPQPDVVELPRIGHYPQLESPREVLAAYLAFRAGIPAA
jgi:pimeloyl-ACP methyl ester carboxylesterase